MKSMIQTNNENCVTSSTEKVPVSEDILVVNNEVETVEDAEDNASDIDDNEGNDLIFMVFCEKYVS